MEANVTLRRWDITEHLQTDEDCKRYLASCIREAGDPALVVDAARAVVRARGADTAWLSLMRPLHPGEVLLEDFLIPLRLSPNDLADALGVHPDRLHRILGGQSPIDADVAARLARYLGNDARSWMALQAAYDLKTLPWHSDIERRVLPRKG